MSEAPQITGVNDLSTVSGTVLIDGGSSSLHKLVASGNVTARLASVKPGQPLALKFTQDGVGGRALAFAGGQTVNTNGLTITPAAAPGAVTIYQFICAAADMASVDLVAVSSLLSGGSSFLFDPGPPTAVTDASQSISVVTARWFTAALALFTAPRNFTLSPTGAALDAQLRFTRYDVSNNAIAIINGGPGAGTLVTFGALCNGDAIFRFDGTNWTLLESSSASAAAIGNTIVMRGPTGSAAFDIVTMADLLFTTTETTPTISQNGNVGAGATLTIIPQIGATPGVDAGGDLKVTLGQVVGAVSSALRLFSAATSVAQFDYFSGYFRVSGTPPLLLNPASITFEPNDNLIHWWSNSPTEQMLETIGTTWTRAYVNGVTVLNETGANVVWSVGFKDNKLTGGRLVERMRTSAGPFTGAITLDTQTGGLISTGTLTGNATITLSTLVNNAGADVQSVDIEIVSNLAAGRTCTFTNATVAAEIAASLPTAIANGAVKRVICTLKIYGGVAYVASFASFAT